MLPFISLSLDLARGIHVSRGDWGLLNQEYKEKGSVLNYGTLELSILGQEQNKILEVPEENAFTKSQNCQCCI